MNLNKYIQERYQQEYDKGYKAAQEKEAEHTLRLIKPHEDSLRAVIAETLKSLMMPNARLMMPNVRS